MCPSAKHCTNAELFLESLTWMEGPELPPSVMTLDLSSLSSTDYALGQPHTCNLSGQYLCLTRSHTHLITTKLFIAAMTVVLTSITLGIIHVTGGFILKNTNWNNFEMQRETLITRLCTEYTAFRILLYSLC